MPTPLMKQYSAIKSRYRDAVLFFRMGDFYEMFNEDAKVASKILNIALTSRNREKDKKVPLCGIPYHAAENYISKIIKVGKKVAICEQVEDPAKAKGLVKREVVRVITPGTTLSGNILDDKKNNYIVSIVNEKDDAIGVSFADLTTGEFKLTEFESKSALIGLKDLIASLTPSEIIVPESLYNQKEILQALKVYEFTNIFHCDDYIFEESEAKERLKEHFGTSNLEGFGVENYSEGLKAAGGLLSYLKENQKTGLPHIRKISYFSKKEKMILDEATMRNLELVFTIRGFNKKGSLLDVLDQTQTPMGGRMLRKWLLSPLISSKKINTRLAGVKELSEDFQKRDELIEVLRNIRDIERILGKIGCRSVNARDLITLKISLQQIPKMNNLLHGFKSEILKRVNKLLAYPKHIVDLLENAIADEPALLLNEGNLIKRGYDKELDELKELAFGGRDWIKELEINERKRTGINSLKVKYNKIFGYYIEVSKTKLSKVPENYIRRQTLVNAERYIIPELEEKEKEVLNAEEKMINMEYKLFCRVRDEILKQVQSLQQVSKGVAMADVLANFAWIAEQNNYVMPEVNDSDSIEIVEGRHPTVEKMDLVSAFVPNNAKLDGTQNQVIILTGPNMAGKSTYIRQVALICLMAQIGSFVPANSAKLGVVDRIFTRVGASDSLISGQSTFMVEMQETANILNSATAKSLIVLDEIGRGTSTFDGLSIAWAVAEYIHNKHKLGAKTLFATHYHELSELPKLFPRIKNYNIAVKESGNKVVFLRKVVEGPADKSYGIYVAKLAGLPSEVVSRAEQVLKRLEKSEKAREKEMKVEGAKEEQQKLI